MRKKRKIISDYIHQTFKAHLSCHYVSSIDNLTRYINIACPYHTYAAPKKLECFTIGK